MPGISCRPATIDDARDVHALLLLLAPEIPLLVDTLQREEALYALVRDCARSGESWVAVEEGGGIVGFALAEPNQFSRHYAEGEVFELRYAGVAPDYRGQGVFTSLIGQILARLLPVTAAVPAHNRFDVATRLQRLGFRQAASDNRLRWEPGAGR